MTNHGMRMTLAFALALTAGGALARPAGAAAGQLDAGDDFAFLSQERPGTDVRLSEFEGGAHVVGWSIGPTAGYIKTRDADEASWFGGVAARVSISEMFGGEASIVFRRDEYLDGDMTITQYPVQLTGLFMPPLGNLHGIQPYALLGYGLYYARSDFSGALSALSSETDSMHGIHIGVGVQASLAGSVLGFADFRYVFIDEPGVDNSQLDNEEFDFLQIALGVTFSM